MPFRIGNRRRGPAGYAVSWSGSLRCVPPSKDRHVRRFPTLLLVAALLAASCGDDDGSGLSSEEQGLADALAISIMADADPDNPFGRAEDAHCFAEGLVGTIGVARLATLGLTAESESPEAAFDAMTPGERDDVVEVALGCTDAEGVMVAELEATGMSSDSAACIAEALGESDFFRDAFLAGMAGREFDPEANPEYTVLLLEAATDCLSPSELGPLFGGDD